MEQANDVRKDTGVFRTHGPWIVALVVSWTAAVTYTVTQATKLDYLMDRIGNLERADQSLSTKIDLLDAHGTRGSEKAIEEVKREVIEVHVNQRNVMTTLDKNGIKLDSVLDALHGRPQAEHVP